MAQDEFWESDDVMSEQEANAIIAQSTKQEDSQPEAYEYAQEEPSYEESTYEEDQDFLADLEVLKNARLRLEQGKLYEMLLKHDLFVGVDADSKAISNVQRELRAFIKERLEILVGLKPDPRLAPKQAPTNLGMFSEVELQVLKQFVSKVAQPKDQQRPAPIKAPQSPVGLRPVGSPNVRVTNDGLKKPSTALKKTKPELEGPGLTKAPSQMTIQELKEYNKNLAARQAAKKSAQPNRKLPMPDGRQLEAMYASRVNTDPGQGLIGAIMQKMGKSVGISEHVSGGSGDDSNDSRM